MANFFINDTYIMDSCRYAYSTRSGVILPLLRNTYYYLVQAIFIKQVIKFRRTSTLRVALDLTYCWISTKLMVSNVNFLNFFY